MSSIHQLWASSCYSKNTKHPVTPDKHLAPGVGMEKLNSRMYASAKLALYQQYNGVVGFTAEIIKIRSK